MLQFGQFHSAIFKDFDDNKQGFTDIKLSKDFHDSKLKKRTSIKYKLF